jgi:hypothetical protein
VVAHCAGKFPNIQVDNVDVAKSGGEGAPDFTTIATAGLDILGMERLQMTAKVNWIGKYLRAKWTIVDGNDFIKGLIGMILFHMINEVGL